MTDDRWSGSFDTTSISDDGEYTIQLITKDGAGNQTMKYVDILVDNTAPDAPTLISPSNEEVVSGNPTQSWNGVSDADHYIYASYTDADGNDEVYSTSVNGTSRTVGGNQNITFYWRVKVVDAVGNESDWSEMRKLTIDNTAPTLESKTNFGSTWYGTSQTSVFTYTDPNLVSEYTDPTCDITTEGASQTCSVTPNVCDEAGNCNTDEVTSNGANIDKEKPTASITTPVDGAILQGTFTVEGTASDADSGVNRVEYKVNEVSAIGGSYVESIASGTATGTKLLEFFGKRTQ